MSENFEKMNGVAPGANAESQELTAEQFLVNENRALDEEIYEQIQNIRKMQENLEDSQQIEEALGAYDEMTKKKRELLNRLKELGNKGNKED